LTTSRDKYRPVHDHARELRLQGQLRQALQLPSKHLGDQPWDRAIMAEAGRILICLGQAEPAVGLYQTLTTDPHAGVELEAPAIVGREAPSAQARQAQA
jgi:hypothetical protein